MLDITFPSNHWSGWVHIRFNGSWPYRECECCHARYPLPFYLSRVTIDEHDYRVLWGSRYCAVCESRDPLDLPPPGQRLKLRIGELLSESGEMAQWFDVSVNTYSTVTALAFRRMGPHSAEIRTQPYSDRSKRGRRMSEVA